MSGWDLFSLICSLVAAFAIGLNVGMWLCEPRPRVPEHPSLRRTTQRPRLRVIDGGYQPYDQDREMGG